MHVPCGRCEACRVERSAEWAVRIVHEAACHDRNVFATLTFSEEHVPKDGQLRKSDLQLFFKRLRKGLSVPIKYYACGEYGERFGRPHYHALIFGIGPEDQPAIERAWHRGIVDVGCVEYRSARYVANYIQKVFYGDGSRVQPFALMSKGIGKEFAEKHRVRLWSDLSVTLDGIPRGMPKYYARILGIPTEMLMESRDEALQELDDFYRRKMPKATDEQVYQAVLAARRQNELNISARSQLYRSKL